MHGTFDSLSIYDVIGSVFARHGIWTLRSMKDQFLTVHSTSPPISLARQVSHMHSEVADLMTSFEYK
jgi:hypothetical protein